MKLLHLTTMALLASPSLIIPANFLSSDNLQAYDGDKDAFTTESQRLSSVDQPWIVVRKHDRKLEFYSGKKLLKTYKIALGFNPEPDKEREGDGATPEGEFYVFVKNIKSAYYLSLGLSYPNEEDARRGLKDGLISAAEYDAILKAIRSKKMPPQYTKLGGLIYIHGHGTAKDWTWGCVALENDDINELFDVVEVGTPVTIKH
ncbi:MAG TPA: L,D-transpeptidase [Pyrinomonadaceae bacterium]|nr:L,D-transpeptidase [Pyrinomonadaceae bacterium]